MEQPNLTESLWRLAPAIDHRPLTVAPDVSLKQVMTVMGKGQSSCVVPSLNVQQDIVFSSEVRSGAVFLKEGPELVGLLTATDILQAIASGRNLAAIRTAEVMRQPVPTLTYSADSNIFTALSLLRQHQLRHLPIVDSQGELMGMVTLESIHRVLPLEELQKAYQLADVIVTPLILASVTSTALDLAELMAEHQVNSIVLTKTNSEQEIQPVGIITERDIIQLQALELNLSQIQAENLMNRPLVCFDSSESLLAAYWKMQQQGLQQFAVSGSAGELLGIVTPTSFLETLDLEVIYSAVEQLQHSIDKFANEKANLPITSSTNSLEFQGKESKDELLEQLQCNRLLTAMALRIRESLNLDEILNTSVAEVREFLQTDRVIIYQFNPDLSGTVVVESVASGWQPALNSTIQDTCFGKDYAQRYKEGRMLVAEDIYTVGLTQCHIDILALFDIRASLVVPIVQGEHLWGLLCAYHCSKPRYWRQLEIDLLKQLATHIAIAIQQSELYQQVQTELAERKRAEDQIKASLKEKEILLKEVHHRVKNNLQIISSLLRLQSDYIKDEKTITAFKDSQNRIRSMALIHEKLYQSKDLLKIDFAEYMNDMISNLLRSYTASYQDINPRIDANHILLSIDTAIPCGLIINELVSNSLKHAFPNPHPNKEIHIEIQSDDNDRFQLIVEDNGVGFPSELDFQNTESLGLQLVCTFTEQMEGTIELDNSNGTKFIICFAEVKNSKKG